jgi:hypothetical protein
MGTERWDVKEFTLEAHYINRVSDSITLSCRSISKLPAEYYPDQQSGLDGAVIRSLKEPATLLILGVRPADLYDLKWQPSELAFADGQSGNWLHFHGALGSTNEIDAVRFQILD